MPKEVLILIQAFKYDSIPRRTGYHIHEPNSSCVYVCWWDGDAVTIFLERANKTLSKDIYIYINGVAHCASAAEIMQIMWYCAFSAVALGYLFSVASEMLRILR